MNIVTIKDLVKRYDDLVALDHVSLEIEEGQVFALLGPNGSGKSTLILCLLSVLSYDHGEINIFNQPMHAGNDKVKRRIGYVPQDITVYEELTVYENIDHFCSLYIADKKVRQQLVEQAIDFVQLEEFTQFKPSQLSGGLKRRLNLACGIAHQPDLIILDEPTVAVDPQSRNRILEGIKQLANSGKTIIYTTHYMEEVQMIADHIAILDAGKILIQGTNADIIETSSVAETIEFVIINLDERVLNQFLQDPEIISTDYNGRTLTLHLKKGGKTSLDMLKFLEDQELEPLAFSSKKPSLNDVFLEITGKELRDHG
ncbi:ATP-binding cassette domain-containing protein [Hutsoniella sourekii]